MCLVFISRAPVGAAPKFLSHGEAVWRQPLGVGDAGHLEYGSRVRLALQLVSAEADEAGCHKQVFVPRPTEAQGRHQLRWNLHLLHDDS